MKDLGVPKRYIILHPPSRDDVTYLRCRYSLKDLGVSKRYVIPTPAEMT